MQRQLTLGLAFKRGAEIFGARLPALLGTYFAGLGLQFAVMTLGFSVMASVATSSGSIAGVALIVVLVALALIVVVGVEYLVVAQVALDAHDRCERRFGEVVALAFGRLGSFVLRVVVLALFISMLRLGFGLLLFPLVGVSSSAALVVTVLFVVFTVALFVLVLAFLPFVVLEKLKDPIRSSIAISFERAFTVLPVLFSMGLALILAGVLGLRAEMLGLGMVGQLLVIGIQGVVYVFGYCVLSVIYRASSLGEVAPKPTLAVPPVPGAFAQFSIMPGGGPVPGTRPSPARTNPAPAGHVESWATPVPPGAPNARARSVPQPSAWQSVQVTPPGAPASPTPTGHVPHPGPAAGPGPAGLGPTGPGTSAGWEWARGAASPPTPSGELAATDSGTDTANPHSPPPPPVRPGDWPPQST